MLQFVVVLTLFNGCKISDNISFTPSVHDLTDGGQWTPRFFFQILLYYIVVRFVNSSV